MIFERRKNNERKEASHEMAAAFVAAAVFSSTAVAVSANAENSVYYWGTYKDEKGFSSGR